MRIIFCGRLSMLRTNNKLRTVNDLFDEKMETIVCEKCDFSFAVVVVAEEKKMN